MSLSNSNALQNLIIFPEDCQLVGLSNWAVFCDRMKSVACSTGLGGYLDRTITAPPTLTAPTAGTALPQLLLLLSIPNIKDPLSIGVTQDMPSNAMWTTLTGEYKTTSAAAQTLVKECIQQFKYVSGTGTPFEEYFGQLEALQKATSNVGCTISDNDLHSQFLTSLSIEYLWVLQTHSACSYSDLKCALMKYNMMVESSTNTSGNVTVLNTLATAGKSGSRIICDNCKCTGHVKRNCWTCGGGSEGKGPRWYSAPKGMELNKLSVSLTVASTSASDPGPDTATAAATIYDFGDFELGGTTRYLDRSSPSDFSFIRLGREASAFLSRTGSNTISIPSSTVPPKSC
ncbi:hypothetical protein GYMLUDRAFT_248885 [Collybiopsis luxurians FD-317 M1]|uniref:CCHC-type domain-containing protein n=1 Tax=Collybiopsis luxurians FD-317 M1 TaxID=944289 RepID=A0A0D0BYX5_9AGAR|nr:hypothetical protein GYMLUDRAFT_248885 [Collybiopsis luxurians FD-317 M1]